jgi:hypothetical protein
MSFAPDIKPLAKPETLLRVPVGMASPLWGLFAGAAMTGAAWWWMTRWTRPQNLEAMFGAAEAMVEAPPEPVIEPVAESTVEAAPEPAPEAVVEAAPETVAEALIEASPAPFAVGGESAPISPVLEALAPEIVKAAIAAEAAAAEVAAEPAPAPKPRKKAASPAPSDAPD